LIQSAGAEAVLVGVVVASRLDEADHRGVVGREPAHQGLRRDPAVLEDGPRWRRPQPVRGAVDVDGAPVGRDLAVVEHEPGGVDAADVSPPDDAVDLPEALVLGRADDRATEHRRRDGGVEAQDLAAVLEPAEEVGHVIGLRE
jgi:hypothetical protein